MKKLMIAMVALAFLSGTVALAQEKQEPTKTEKKKSPKKKTSKRKAEQPKAQ
jgi:Ni/Co efflux regulator RcnB